MRRNVISCEFNIDTASVKVKYADGGMFLIYRPRAKNQVAENMFEQSELD